MSTHYEKYGRRWYVANKQKELVRAKESYRNNKELRLKQQRISMLLYRYGIVEEDYRVLLKKQGNKCAICGKPPKEGRALDVDHCHATGKVRGLLCNNCNRGIGHLQDDLAVLEAAIDYLKGGVCE